VLRDERKIMQHRPSSLIRWQKKKRPAKAGRFFIADY
jgi:hypothetical protein